MFTVSKIVEILNLNLNFEILYQNYQSFFFIYKLMNKNFALKEIVKFALKMLRHVSV
jgi:hypothetical protein